MLGSASAIQRRPSIAPERVAREPPRLFDNLWECARLNPSTKEECAHFWRCNAGQLRLLAQARISGESVSERLLKLASEYDRLADSLAFQLPGHAGQLLSRRIVFAHRANRQHQELQPVKRRS
jgi:hypothetical protein